MGLEFTSRGWAFSRRDGRRIYERHERILDELRLPAGIIGGGREREGVSAVGRAEATSALAFFCTNF
jgi:hypothetical protein